MNSSLLHGVILFVPISFSDFRSLIEVENTCVVAALFEAAWKTENQISRDRRAILSSLLHAEVHTVYNVVVHGSDEAEEFVINDLKVNDLPVIALFSQDGTRHYQGGLNEAGEFDEPAFTMSMANCLTALSSMPKNNQEETSASVVPYPASTINLPLLISNMFSISYDNEPLLLFLSGDRSSVGKSSTCLSILAALVTLGVDPSLIAYIKPVTQCEAEQPVTQYCQRVGISHVGIGPVVFYKGFTRAFLKGETEPSTTLIQTAVDAVNTLAKGKRLVVVDGVGYPAVGSICNLSNGDIARALQAPVVLIGKSGVGDAVDSYNMNARFFETYGVTVLGGIFNKLPLEGLTHPLSILLIIHLAILLITRKHTQTHTNTPSQYYYNTHVERFLQFGSLSRSRDIVFHSISSRSLPRWICAFAVRF